jgi:hypothetical protein
MAINRIHIDRNRRPQSAPEHGSLVLESITVSDTIRSVPTYRNDANHVLSTSLFSRDNAEQSKHRNSYHTVACVQRVLRDRSPLMNHLLLLGSIVDYHQIRIIRVTGSVGRDMCCGDIERLALIKLTG